MERYGYLELIITASGSAGLGGVVAAWFQSHFEKKKDIEETLREEKRKRYGVSSPQVNPNLKISQRGLDYLGWLKEWIKK